MTFLPYSNFLEISMRCSILIGAFPNNIFFIKQHRHSKFACLYSIFTKICFGIFSAILLSSVLQLLIIICKKNIDFIELSKNLTLTPIFTITFIRQISITTPKFVNLMKQIIDNENGMKSFSDKEVQEIEIQYARKMNFNIKIYLLLMIITELSFTTGPLFLPKEEVLYKNETFYFKQMPLSLWFPFAKENHFPLTYFCQCVTIIFGSTYETFGEFILISVLVYPIARLKILNHIFKNLEKYQKNVALANNNANLHNGHEAYFVTLKACIKWHLKIIRYVEDFNSTMSTCMFLDFIQSSVNIACVLVEILKDKVTLMELISTTAYSVILIFRLLLFYYYANELTLLNEELAVEIYKTSWYEQSKNVKFITLMIMMRNQNKSLSYKLGIFGEMSLKKFLAILNAAYSYIMLMHSVN